MYHIWLDSIGSLVFQGNEGNLRENLFLYKNVKELSGKSVPFRLTLFPLSSVYFWDEVRY